LRGGRSEWRFSQRNKAQHQETVRDRIQGSLVFLLSSDHGWSAWKKIDGHVFSHPSLAFGYSGEFRLFSTGQQGTLIENDFDGVQQAFRGWNDLGGGSVEGAVSCSYFSLSDPSHSNTRQIGCFARKRTEIILQDNCNGLRRPFYETDVEGIGGLIMPPEIATVEASSTAPPGPPPEGFHSPELPPSSRTDDSNVVETAGQRRKKNLRYQHGYLYEDHGAWFVRYRQKDESGNVVYTAKHLGRCQDFFDIAEVEQCRTQFMQTINRDRLNGNSRITLATFVEGAYLPWTKEEHRASTSKGHHEIWRNYLRERVGELPVREFRTVDANRLLCAIGKERDLTRATLQHIKSVLSTIFNYARNEGVFELREIPIP